MLGFTSVWFWGGGWIGGAYATTEKSLYDIGLARRERFAHSGSREPGSFFRVSCRSHDSHCGCLLFLGGSVEFGRDVDSNAIKGDRQIVELVLRID